jgi:hypothetical protein
VVHVPRPGDGLWQSGLLAEDGSPKPALERFTVSARRLDARNPVLPGSADVARVPALELAYYVPPDAPIAVTVGGRRKPAVPLRPDGWIEVPLGDSVHDVVVIRATDPHGHSVVRTVRLEDREAIALR